MATDRDWERALPHRKGEDFISARARLSSACITPAEVAATLADAGDSLLLREMAEEPLRVALLWNELGAYLAYAQERAAAGRRAAYTQLLSTMSLATLAGVVGVSRQAVHKAVTGATAGRNFAPRLSNFQGGDD